MKAQAALEFLYTYGFVIILALVAISIIFHYFSLSLGSAPQCVLPNFLKCEQFFISKHSLQLNISNNFNYDVRINDVSVSARDNKFVKSFNKTIPRGESYILDIPINVRGTSFYGKLNISYSPCIDGICSSNKYHIIGYISGTIEE